MIIKWYILSSKSKSKIKPCHWLLMGRSKYRKGGQYIVTIFWPRGQNIVGVKISSHTGIVEGAGGTARPADLNVAVTVFWMKPAHSASEPKFWGIGASGCVELVWDCLGEAPGSDPSGMVCWPAGFVGGPVRGFFVGVFEPPFFPLTFVASWALVTVCSEGLRFRP